VIANGAECEPLLHKDAAVMEHWAGDVVRGMVLTMEAVGAKDGFVGIKAKNKQPWRPSRPHARAPGEGFPVRRLLSRRATNTISSIP
jgi:Na+-translocating ferredoxin:NAD+ oxidoreductase RnfC subunit